MGKLHRSSPSRTAPPRHRRLPPSSLGARVRKTNGQFKVTDGPFTEAKEIVGGFALIKAKSKEDAIEFTKNFLNIAGDGEIEIRQVYEQPAK